MAEEDPRLRRLRSAVRASGPAAVALSGGLDSTLVAKVAKDELGDEVVAVTIDSPLLPRSGLAEARAAARALGVRHLVVTRDPLADPRFARNPPDRCYMCKLADLREVRRLAEENGLKAVLDGTNADDLGDRRPGLRAGEEVGVRSPLAEAGLSKRDVVELSLRLRLPTRGKDPSPCLATRVPYGDALTADLLDRVGKAEEYLRRKGFGQVRVRAHGDVARIEVPEGRAYELARPGTRKLVVRRLKSLGFAYVSLDLEGYRSGSMDEVLDG